MDGEEDDGQQPSKSFDVGTTTDQELQRKRRLLRCEEPERTVASLSRLCCPPRAAASCDELMRDWQIQMDSSSSGTGVILKPSSSNRRRPSIYFSRDLGALPDYCFRPPRDLQVAAPLYKITSATCEYVCLRLVLLRAGFRRIADLGADVDCNIFWGKSISGAEDARTRPKPVHQFQRNNHFSQSFQQIGCKSGVFRNIEQKQKECKIAGAFDITPRTWRLPEDVDSLLAELDHVDATGPFRRFIYKPSRGSCGHGIQMAQTNDELRELLSRWNEKQSKTVVQQYIDRPLLVQGRKFDLRIYVAATSLDPLVLYVHKDGLVRFAAQAYDSANIQNRFAHLTNFSVGRHMQVEGDGPKPELKWSLGALNEYFKQNGVDAAHVWQQADDVIVKTLIAAEPRLRRALSKDSVLVQRAPFELYGFDLLIDADQRVWLLEVNTLPSLESSSSLDYDVKSNVITDFFNMLQIELFERPQDVFRSTGYAMPAALSSEVRSIVHATSECYDATVLPLSEQVEETLCRLADEERYCGGFRRILPVKKDVMSYPALFTDSESAPSPLSESLWQRLS